jgi:hypothetical protein
MLSLTNDRVTRIPLDGQACNGIQDGECEPGVIYVVCVHLFIWIGLRLRWKL